MIRSPLLLVAVPLPEAIALRAQSEFSALLSQGAVMTSDVLLQAVQTQATIQAILVSSRIKVDSTLINSLPEQIKLIATCSAGTEHIDIQAAKSRGILVTNTPEVLTESTADMAMLVMLGAARRMREYSQIMDAGWRQRYGLGEMLGTDLRGKTLGIVGMGRIGQALAQRARAFGMNIAYHNRKRLPKDLEQGAHYCESLEELLPLSQVLSLNAPGGETMNGLLNRRALALMPRGCIVVNTARGQLVNDDDLIDAIKSGHVSAAGLDVFSGEPAFDLRYRELPQVFMAPHMGSATVETRDAMGHRALDNIAALEALRPIPDLVD